MAYTQEQLDNIQSEKTRFNFEFMGWSTMQWNSPLDILIALEEMQQQLNSSTTKESK